MKKLLPVITTLILLGFVSKARASYFFLSIGATSAIVVSPLLSTVTACQAQAQVTNNLLTGADCAASCSKGAALYNFTYYVNAAAQQRNRQTPVGSYAFQSDCIAGFEAAQAAGFLMGPKACVYSYKCSSK